MTKKEGLATQTKGKEEKRADKNRERREHCMVMRNFATVYPIISGGKELQYEYIMESNLWILAENKYQRNAAKYAGQIRTAAGNAKAG